MTDLSTLASSVLVTLFNNLATDLPADSRPAEVKKFSDKKAGIRRVETLLEQVNEVRKASGQNALFVTDGGAVSEVEPDSTDEGSTDEGSEDSGNTGGETGLESADDPNARTTIGSGETFKSEEPAPQPAKAPSSAPAAKTTKAKGAARGPGGRPPSVAESDVITLIMTAKNPKRSAAADRFSCYKTGMTVGEYMEAIGGDRKQALRDIAWDMKQGWISIAGAKGAKTEEASAEDKTEAKTEEAA